VVVTVGGLRQEVTLEARAGDPASARLEVRRQGPSRAEVALEVRDRLGNLAALDQFRLEVEGADAEPIAPEADAYRTTISARPGATRATLSLRAGGRRLATAEADFAPPSGGFVVGAYGEGGWAQAGGLAGARVGAGLALRRSTGPVELALSLGVESFRASDHDVVMLTGGPAQTVDLALRTLALPLRLRARLAVWGPLGAFASIGAVGMRVDVASTSDFQGASRYTELIVGARALAGLDARLGPGRITAAASYGRAQLQEGPVVGGIEGLTLSGGYEWYFTAFGR